VGSVVAFNAQSCPAGWVEYTPAQGRFIRGIDKPGGNTDPDGHRAPGTTQGDAVGPFTFRTDTDIQIAASGTRFRGAGQASNSGAGKEAHDIAAATGVAETRPRNVALTLPASSASHSGAYAARFSWAASQARSYCIGLT
jgi:hypothetical protein